MAGAGAIAGGIAARRDAGFKDERLERLGESLKPGSSAIVAVVEHTWVAQLRDELAEAHADVTTEELASDIAAQLEAGGEVSYTAIQSEEGGFAGRVATRETGADAEFVAVSDEGSVEGGVSVEQAGEDAERGTRADEEGSSG
jgi:hypothetical protein